MKPKIEEVGKRLGQVNEELPRATGRDASNLRAQREALLGLLDELNDFRDELSRWPGCRTNPTLTMVFR